MSISDISQVLHSYDCIHEKQVEFFTIVIKYTS